MDAPRTFLSTWLYVSSTHQKKAKLEGVSNQKWIEFKGNGIPPLPMESKFRARCMSYTMKIGSRQIPEFSRPINHPTASPQLNNGHDLCTVRAHKLKVLKLMLTKLDDGIQALLMIDDIQRFGIDYLFQKEIEAVLQDRYVKFSLPRDSDPFDSLHEAALLFRLLRQQGFPISTEIFGKFMDEKGKIRCDPTGDIKGLISLYEASQLSITGEDLLDEARIYSYEVLSSILKQLDDGATALLRETLQNPHHRSLVKFTSKNFMKNYLPGENGWGWDLKSLANLESKTVQVQYQQEIDEIYRWWKGLGLSKELKFARDRPLIWYMSTVACLTEPKLSQERIHLMKPISFIYLIDDIFDLCGQPDELVIFADVVNRWDMLAADNLPEQMKVCFKALDKITYEISQWVYDTHGWDPTDSLRKAWASLCGAFLVEAKWFAAGHLPKSGEYLKNGIISSGVHVVLVHIFFLLGQAITKQNVELIENNPGIISSPASILRLWDDLGSAKDEDQNEHDGSYVDCYLNENRGHSLDQAREFVNQLISESWKQLNEECLSPNPFPLAFTNAALNLARSVSLLYGYDNNHRLSRLEEHTISLLYDNEQDITG